MQKRNVIEEGRTPQIEQQTELDFMEKAAVNTFKAGAIESRNGEKKADKQCKCGKAKCCKG